MFEKMVTSIQTDEARHSQIGHPVLAQVIKHDPEYAQYLVDKWFWRNWHLFSFMTGVSMDYLRGSERRSGSFKEFMEEWIIDQFFRTIDEFGLKKPWYWEIFLNELEIYHHMLYVSAYTYRATLWFDVVMPTADDRRWLREKYPKYWEDIDIVWERLAERWKKSDSGGEGEPLMRAAALPAFCNLCQLSLSAGTPRNNTANVLTHEGTEYIFCSQPCRWIFLHEPERYAGHRDLVKRVLCGEAPADFAALVTDYFKLTPDTWGKDACGGMYK